MSPQSIVFAAGTPAVTPFGFALLASLVVVIIWMVRRKLAENEEVAAASFTGGTSRPSAVNVVLGQDGFWLRSDTLRPGSIIAYYCYTTGRTVSGQVRFESSANGHFVYTGSKPTRVDITRVVDADQSDASADTLPLSETNFSVPAAAWYASQDQQADPAPAASERQDPPAY